jgi:hypothetical protein
MQRNYSGSSIGNRSKRLYTLPDSVDAHDWKLYRSIFTDKIEILLSVGARADRPHQIVTWRLFVEGGKLEISAREPGKKM